MSKNIKVNNKTRTNNINSRQPLTAQVLGLRIFVVFMIVWLIFGELIGEAAVSYAASANTNYAAINNTTQTQAAIINQNQNTLKSSAPTTFTPTNHSDLTTLKNAYTNSSLNFELNQGQSDATSQYVARGFGYNLSLAPNQINLFLNRTSPVSSTNSTGNSSNDKPTSGAANNGSNCSISKSLSAATTTANTPKVSCKLGESRSKDEVPAMTQTTLNVKLVGANDKASLQGYEKRQGSSNYFIGNNPKSWLGGVKAYGRVEAKDIYPGIDVEYYGTQRQLEYDFVVSPNSDLSLITFQFSGADRAILTSAGDINLFFGTDELTQPAPTIYQEINGVRTTIKGNYVAKSGSNTFGFVITGNYDHSQPLIIDPSLNYSTYFYDSRNNGNGNNDDGITAVTTDSAGNFYFTGFSYINNKLVQFPDGITYTVSDYDVVVYRISPNASYYLGYFGGASRDRDSTRAPNNGYDFGRAIATDGNGDVFVTGETYSFSDTSKDAPFPTTAGAFEDGSIPTNNIDERAFVLKVNTFLSGGPDLVYASYLSGQQQDLGTGIGVDSSGKIYITGDTFSSQFPTTTTALQPNFPYSSSGQSIFLTELDTTLTGINQLVYSSYLGGSVGDGAYGLALDPNGNVYITGLTESPNLATPNAFQHNYTGNGNLQAFVAEFSPFSAGVQPTLKYYTYLGGTTADSYATAIALDNSGNAYVTGSVSASDFPTTTNAYQATLKSSGSNNAFVAKINTTISGTASLLYSTYLGGSGSDIGNGIAVDNYGNAYVTGNTSSSNFPTTTTAYQPAFKASGGNTNAFVVRIETTQNLTASLRYGSYLGGSGSDEGKGIAVDHNGYVFVAGQTNSQDFPLAYPNFPIYPDNQEYHPTYNGGVNDGFITELFPGATANSIPYGGCANEVRATEFIEPGSASEQLQCQIINTTTGNFAASNTDLNLAPPPELHGLGLSFGRNYNSLDNITQGAMGFGWRYSYEWSLVENSDVVTITEPSGKRDVYPHTDISFDMSAANLYSNGVLTLTKSIASTYSLTDLDGTTYKFNSSGKISKIRNRTQGGLNFTYDGNGNLTEIDLCLSQCDAGTNAEIAQTLLVTTNNGLITDVSDNLGRKVHYTYTNNLLTAVTDTRNNTTNLTYYSQADGQPNRLSSVTDPKGDLVIALGYEPSLGRVITASIDPAYQPVSLDYSNPNYTLVTNRLGKHTAFYHDDPNYPYHTTKVVDLDQLGQPAHSYTYDSNYRVTSFTDADGHTSYYTYTLNSSLPSIITHPVTVNGSVVVYQSQTSYNQYGQPLVITDTNGNVNYLSYDNNGNLITAQDPLSNTASYFYADATHPGRLTSVTTSNGQSVSYSYYSNGFPQKIIRSFSTFVSGTTSLQNVYLETDYSYDSAGRVLVQSDPYYQGGSAAQTQFGYDAADHVVTTTNQIGEQSINSYDAAGNLQQNTNFLHQVAIYGYDSHNWLTDITLNVSTASGGILHTHNQYDAAGNLHIKTDPRSVQTTYTYDSLNRLTDIQVPLQAGGTAETTYVLDNVGNITQTTYHNQGNGYSGDEVTSYNYDELNRLINLTSGVGSYNYKTVNTYDADGNLLAVQQSNVNSPTDPALVTLKTVQYDALNRPLYSTVYGSNGAMTSSYSYNDKQNQSTITDPYGVKTLYQNDPTGRLIQTIVTPASTTNGEQAQTTSYYYDPRDLLVRTIDPSGNWFDTAYDALQRPTAQIGYPNPSDHSQVVTSRTSYTDQSQPIVTTIASDQTGTRQDSYYDEAGRLTKAVVYTNTSSIPNTALTTSYTYDGQDNPLSVTDPKGHVVNYSYENTGWLTGVSEKVTMGGSLQTLTTNYSYDLVGNLLTTKDANNHTTTNSYDVLNRLVTQKDPLTNSFSWQYDGLDRLVKYTDAKGQQTTYSYDTASRLLQVASTGGLNTSYVYNNSTDSPTQMQDTSGSSTTNTNFNYDGFNRLLNVANSVGTVGYRYDNSNRRSQLTYSTSGTNRSASYSYDGMNRLKSVTNWNNAALTYNYNGEQLTGINYPNNIVGAFGYDGADRLTNIAYTRSGTTVFSAGYQLDNNGNHLSASEVVNGTSNNYKYSYDELNRLTQEVVGTNTTSYQYDAMGNRTLMSQVKGTAPRTTTTNYSYTYNAADELISQTVRAQGNTTPVTYNYTYDANGSLTNQVGNNNTITYTYDTRNRLTQWQQNQTGSSTTNTANYSYDGAGNRVSQTYNGTTTSYLQDATDGGGSSVVAEVGSGGKVSSFLYSPGSTQPLFQTDGTNQDSWYQLDSIGSVRTLTDDSGNVRNSYSYTSFGSILSQSGSATNDHTYTGEQSDPSGLTYDRARYYDPSVGRFISRDSFAGVATSPSTLNRYVYANNDPSLYSDPSGHFPFLLGLAAAFIGGAALSFVQQAANNYIHRGSSHTFDNIDGRQLVAAGLAAMVGYGFGIVAKIAGITGFGKLFFTLPSEGIVGLAIDKVVNNKLGVVTPNYTWRDILAAAALGIILHVSVEVVFNSNYEPFVDEDTTTLYHNTRPSDWRPLSPDNPNVITKAFQIDEDTEYIFVITKGGELRLHKQLVFHPQGGLVKHPDLIYNNEFDSAENVVVRYAGTVETMDGAIKGWTNGSGHFRPEPDSGDIRILIQNSGLFKGTIPAQRVFEQR